MEAKEKTLNQEVRAEINAQNKYNNKQAKVIAQNSDTAKRLIAQKAKQAATKDIKQDAEPETTKPQVKKAPKQRGESNEAAAERLLKEKSSAEKILAFYITYYKAKGVTDKKFVQARANIYMKIAQRKADAKKVKA